MKIEVVPSVQYAALSCHSTQGQEMFIASLSRSCGTWYVAPCPDKLQIETVQVLPVLLEARQVCASMNM